MALSQKLAKLEKLANLLGYQVVPGKENTWCPHNRLITINTRQSPIKRAWAMAHEIGHLKTYRLCKKELGKRVFSSPAHTWPSLETEFRAWREADKLIRKLGLFNDAYLKHKHHCIRSYYCS